MRKTLLLLIKFIPVMQMAGMLLNNTLCYFNLNNISREDLDEKII